MGYGQYFGWVVYLPSTVDSWLHPWAMELIKGPLVQTCQVR